MWIVRRGDNEELRYSIRSVTKNLPHGKVWVIGTPPAWYTGSRIPAPINESSRFANVKASTQTAATHPAISDPFVLLHDDQYLMEHIDGIKPTHAGPLAPSNPRATTQRNEARASTLAVLNTAGISNPLTYDGLHTPLLVHKAHMATANKLVAKHGKADTWERTVYGNLADLGGAFATDCKVRHETDATPDGPWISSLDRTFATHPQPLLAATFPEASDYEAAASGE